MNQADTPSTCPITESATEPTNLTHAVEGPVTHLMCQGVTEQYIAGGASANEPG